MISSLLKNDRSAFFAFAVISAIALAIALVSQYHYGLQPCVLCIYQRWPYGLAIVFGILGIALGRANLKTGRALSWLLVLTFLAETVIAFYHTGVERHWWASFLEGCAVPPMEGNITDVLAQIAKTPAVRCDEIPWTDPVIGLSMANYNVALAAALTVAALYSALTRRRT